MTSRNAEVDRPAASLRPALLPRHPAADLEHGAEAPHGVLVGGWSAMPWATDLADESEELTLADLVDPATLRGLLAGWAGSRLIVLPRERGRGLATLDHVGWRIAIRARCAVAVVPADERPVASGVVVGYDASAASRRALGFGVRYAARHGLAVTVVTAVPRDDDWRDHVGPLPDPRRAVEAYRRTVPSVAISIVRHFEPPAVALLDSTGDKALLVLGRDSTAASDGPAGATFRQVLRHAAGALVALPSTWS